MEDTIIQISMSEEDCIYTLTCMKAPITTSYSGIDYVKVTFSVLVLLTRKTLST